MRSSIVTLLGASVALAAMSASSSADPYIEEERPAPPPKRASRQHIKGTTYTPKTPTTGYDRARLEAAEKKRARKAGRLVLLGS